MPNLVKIGPVLLEKKTNMLKVYNDGHFVQKSSLEPSATVIKNIRNNGSNRISFSCFLGNIERRGMSHRYRLQKECLTYRISNIFQIYYLETFFPFLIDISCPAIFFKNLPIMLVKSSISGMEVFPTENFINKVLFVTRMSC